MSKFIYIFLTFPFSKSIWPPPCKINLNHSEEFVIFESFGDPNDIYSDVEMIKSDDLKRLNLDEEAEKYTKIDKYVSNLNKKSKISQSATKIKWNERNFDKEDDVPYIAGVFDSANTNMLKENAKVFYYNTMAKSIVDNQVIKRGLDVVVQKKYVIENETDYDYNEFKNEYEAQLSNFKRDNDTLQFVNVKEEESAKEAIDKMINFTEPLNCTEEEVKGIGIMAMKCLANDLKHIKNSNKPFLIKRIKKILLIWLCVYLAIAIPLWCEKGWCCCCFRCKFCKPLKRIDEVKKFLAENPAGVLTTPEGVKKYNPTHYERYTQKKLEQAIMKL